MSVRERILKIAHHLVKI